MPGKRSSSGKQHVQMFRKIALRKKLLPKTPVTIYVPFLGDGDIAVELYLKNKIYGADHDAARIQMARDRLPKDAILKVSDCDIWPFPGSIYVFDAADFDSYSEPYNSFKSFWQNANKADKLTLFFTDGHPRGILRKGNWTKPDGTYVRDLTLKEKRRIYNFYFKKHILPWFEEYIKPYKIVKKSLYTRHQMLYWGAIIRK
jgi:hypothetical protein